MTPTCRDNLIFGIDKITHDTVICSIVLYTLSDYER